MRPRRSVEVKIKISADNVRGVIEALEQITFEFESHGPRPIVSGGPSVSWTTEAAIDPTITPEKYRESLDEYIGSFKREKDC